MKTKRGRSAHRSNARNGEHYDSGCDFGIAFYYVWMLFHARTFGEISPHSEADHVLGAFITFCGALCWIVPLLWVARKSIMDVAIGKVASIDEPQPTVVGNPT